MRLWFAAAIYNDIINNFKLKICFYLSKGSNGGGEDYTKERASVLGGDYHMSDI